MAWTAVRTWVTGELVSSAIMNQHVRDNLDALRNLMPTSSVRRTTSQSIANTTWTTVSWQTEDYDSGAGLVDWDGSGALSLRELGVYLVCANVSWDSANVNGDRVLELHHAYPTSQDSMIAAAWLTAQDGGFYLHCATVLRGGAAANVYVYARVWQDSGVAVNVVATQSLPNFAAVKIA
jgi:hypothetical protein